MKKILCSLFMLLVSLNAFGADATYNCVIWSLGTMDAAGNNKFLYLSQNDFGKQALGCGHIMNWGGNGCKEGTVVFVKGPHHWGERGKKGDHTEPFFYRCSEDQGFDDWKQAQANIGSLNSNACSDTTNLHKILDLDNNMAIFSKKPLTPYGSYTSYVKGVLSDFCYATKPAEPTCVEKNCLGLTGNALALCQACCNATPTDINWDSTLKSCLCKDTNKVFDIGSHSCIASTEELNCTNSGGSWSNQTCTCDENKKLKSENNVCVCTTADYKFDSSSKTCKLKPAVPDCKNSGGNWNTSTQTCTCDETKNLKEVNNACVCINENYTFDSNSKKCNLKNSVSKEKACKDSGGGWVISSQTCTCDETKNLKEVNNACVCINENFIRSTDERSCVQTQESINKEACNNAVNNSAYWKAGQCICRDNTKIWNGSSCEDNPAAKRCAKVKNAKWNGTKCVCLSTDQELNDLETECVETKEARTKRENNGRAPVIEAAGKELDTIVASFETSKWKNADGKFNTARLASDSIAAVVLGTAGGLITSSVMKKHQVEDGFEDLKCTVGGQPVAGWGDEFQVGIQ